MIAYVEIWRYAASGNNAIATNGANGVDEMAGHASTEGLFAINQPHREQVMALTAIIWSAFAATTAANDALGAALTTATLYRAVAFALASVAGAALCWGLEANFTRLRILPQRFGIAAVFLASCAAAVLWTICTRLAIYPLATAALRAFGPIDLLMAPWPHQTTPSMAFVFLAWSVGWFMLAYASHFQNSRAEADAARVRFAELTNAARPTNEPLTGLWIPKRNGAARLPADEIVTLTAERDYVRIRAVDGTEHLIRATLQNLAAKLDPQSFAQVHRSVIVNTNFVRCVHRRPPRGWMLELANGPQVPVGRSYGETLRRLKVDSR